jgi:uncharacterized membrane protein
MTGWGEFIAALAVFFASHAVPVRPPVRRRLTAALSERGFTLAYSALSLAVLGWLIVAAGRAPYLELWQFAPWQLWVPNLAMVVAVLLMSLAIAAPNPLSFGGARNTAFDPARPGIVGLSRHPLLLALGLWAGAHLAPNGDLAHVVLFGLLGVFATLGMAIIDRRKRRLLGAEEWARLGRGTAWLRPRGIADAFRGAPPQETATRIAIAVLVYAALHHFHAGIIGVAATPWWGNAPIGQ